MDVSAGAPTTAAPLLTDTSLSAYKVVFWV